MATGFLQVQTCIGCTTKPLPYSYIRIYKRDGNTLIYEDFFISDNSGNSIVIPLSITCSNDMPYTTYCVEVRQDGYGTQRFEDIQVFEGIKSTLYVPMIPILEAPFEELTTIIPPHHLRVEVSEDTSKTVMYPFPQGKGGTNDMLRDVIIPTNITVHLGRPSSNAENLTVPFIYYLKNVASSEVYPTWPYEALKANIWAQISLVLNRVFTEWYPSQGYNFDITNSTAYDQAFVKNRNIYDNISAIVDEVFNEYIQKRNFQEPFYAEYCDGKIAQCPGMKQWGTLDLANRGYDAFSILRYYYGDEIRIISSDNMQDIRTSYPGSPLRLGNEGPVVAQLQAQLNGIAINYPNIKPIFPVNGVFGASTQAAVRVFQRQFNLSVDGIVGKATYYKISFVYVAVRKLAELGSLGHLQYLYTGAWQGRVLRYGDRGVETQLMQYYLASISQFYPEIPTVSIDGRFGNGTQNAVTAFQRRFNLLSDGLVGQATWDRIYEVYTSIENELPSGTSPLVYPGYPLQVGSTGEYVEEIQRALNRLRQQYPTIQQVSEDGVFGSGTQNAVREFQRLFNLFADGIVGEATWNVLFSTLASVSQTSSEEDEEVALLQHKLATIASYYPKQLPSITITNVYDDATQKAMLAFQAMMGLVEHGEMDASTSLALNQMYEELQP